MAAIIAAAGRGERARAKQDPPKQFRRLAGKLVIAWSVERFLVAGCSPVVVVVPADDVSESRTALDGSEGVIVVPGGATRQMSVASGLEEIDADKVLVHDGARPLVSAALISRVLDALDADQAVIPALAVEDTLKLVDQDVIVGAVDRSGLVAAQTPQGFETSVLRQAHEKALAEGYEATDDAGLVEHYGVRVTIVEGERTNLKLTYPGDFETAEAIVARVAE